MVLAALLAWTVGGCATAKVGHRAEAPPPPAAYIRKATLPNGAVGLEIALRAFAPPKGRGATLWLAGVMHLGSPAYYAGLQQFLEAQSVVLFEGVGATNRAFQLTHRDGFSLQDALAKALGLTFQLNAIQYNRPHFRNSDVTLAQLERLLARQDEADSGPQKGSASGAGQPDARARSVDFDELVQLMEGTGLLGGLARLGVALIAASERMQAATKVVMVEALAQMPADLAGLPGVPPRLQRLLRVLLEERNRTVLRDVQKALHERPRLKSVAVFYGAAHMADLERRLRTVLHYRPVEERWLRAFEVDPRAAGLSAFELALLRNLINRQMRALGP